MRKIFLIVVATLIVGTMFAESTGISSFPVSMIENFAARPIAMADATVAIRGDVNQICANPAGIANITEMAVSFSRVAWLFDTSFNGLNFVFPIPPEKDTKQYRYGVLGLTANLFTLDGYEALIDGQSIDTVGLEDFMIGVGYAFNIFKPFDFELGEKVHLDFGLLVKYFQSRLADYTSHDLAFDVGMNWSYPVPNLTRFVKHKALKVMKFAPTKRSVKEDTFTVGFAFKNLAVNLSPYYEGSIDLAPWYFDFGIWYLIFGGDSHNLSFATSIKKPSDSTIPFWQIGAEYSYRDAIFVRGGYKITSRTQDGFTFGVGLKFEIIEWLAFSADYSIMLLDNFGTRDVFSVNVIF